MNDVLVQNNKITELNKKALSPFLRPPLSELNAYFQKCEMSLLTENDLNAGLLCELQAGIPVNANDASNKRFVCQDQLSNETRYYEQIIFEEHIIPTRKHSWHDFFNGVIWFRFPLTKAYLNDQHISEINQFGLNPRTKVRNHITHFDECGVVLFIQGNALYTELNKAFILQDWSYIFCELHELWHTSIRPVIFGHANLEMLLSPFIGMTAKVLLIEVNEVLDEITTGLDSEVNRYPHLDLTLYNYLREANILNQKKPFYPLPLLGVPNWHYCVQNNDFYANDAYFMPKRQRDAGV